MCVKGSGKIYWHRELPPGDAEPVGECVIEVTSGHVPGHSCAQRRVVARVLQGLDD
jgi:hypothetical protein